VFHSEARPTLSARAVDAFEAARAWGREHVTQAFALAPIVIVGGAAVLRFIALDSGIPFNLAVDEPEIMDRAVRIIKTGSFNPHFFDYPGLYIYLQAFVACLRFIVGANDGLWTNLDQVGPANFYVWGRGVTALLGTLTVLLVYVIGMRWNRRVAALAAALMAVMPLHVRESHYVLTDVPLTFFVALTLLLSLRAHERPTLLHFCWAGAGAGLAMATKYPGALVLILPLIAVWMTPTIRPSRVITSGAILGSAGLAFLIAAPYTILDLPAFLNAYGHLASYYYTTKSLSEPAAVTYYKHLSRSLGWAGTALMFTGVAVHLFNSVRSPNRVPWTLVLVFPILFFYFLSGQVLIYGRYLLPLVPFVCILAAVACIAAVDLLQWIGAPRVVRALVFAVIAIAAIVPQGVQSISFVAAASRPSTVELTYKWIVANIPKGSKVVIETQALRLPAETYAATNVPQLVLDYRAPGSYEEYVKLGTQYVIASSQRYGDALEKAHELPALYKAYMTLFAQSREVARFSPSPEHPGPELRVYALH
jgi:4-amino-4-deoxy-L-arabinose transferase-like glycosyltransferase